MIKACLASVCEMAVIPLQDYLEQGDEGRINVPSTLETGYGASKGCFNGRTAPKIYSWCKTYRRINPTVKLMKKIDICFGIIVFVFKFLR